MKGSSRALYRAVYCIRNCSHGGWFRIISLFIENWRGKSGRKGENKTAKHKHHKPNHSKTKARKPPTPKPNQDKTYELEQWRGSFMRVCLVFCGTHVVLLAWGALMLRIGPLLNNNAPFQVSFSVLQNPSFLGIYVFCWENIILTLTFFSLLVAKKAQVSQFFKSWPGEMFVMNGIFSLVNKHQLKTNQMSFFGKVNINALVGINWKLKLFQVFARVVLSLFIAIEKVKLHEIKTNFIWMWFWVTSKVSSPWWG